MSKSMGNVVDPDRLIDEYGADTARLFSLFASPPERDLEWSDQGVEGSFRFLARVWRLVRDNLDMLKGGAGETAGGASNAARELRRATHKTIKKVTEDIEDRFHFNTAIAAVMELVNAAYQHEAKRDDPGSASAFREAVEAIILLLSPFAPHIASELWEATGKETSILRTPWPLYDPALIKAEEMTVVVQVNGRLRDRVTAPADASEEDIKAKALGLEKVAQFTGGRTPRKVIYVPGKLVNIVV